ncbi:viroplasmin family protein [Eremococcus coleocola]|uniref:Ribonuclease H n=1 Tax=Eremococcus coleocola ACS-139-V-Col8 TaxID=908337 RepID=E4KPV6_9LACT|nr:ribonuclease H family protein [Eremococcus coleocola]EFR30962.1 ribonuclease HI [Eremococcus coleocola ACS-139-V-Col8]
MAKQKYYAVRKGRQPGIYRTWADCQKQTSGFPGAVFKSFPSQAEAEAFLQGGISSVAPQPHSAARKNKNKLNQSIQNQIDQLRPGQAVVFVDGSFTNHDGRPRYGYGGLIFLPQQAPHQLCQGFSPDQYIDARNVAGEIRGIMAAIDYLLDQAVTTAFIYYDYQGIEAWATGAWSAKKPISQLYVNFLQERQGRINLHFCHVDSHTGVEYNEVVDRLAKKSLGL